MGSLRTRVSNADLRKALIKFRDELGLLRLINYGPGLSGWWFQVDSGENGLSARLVFPNHTVTPSLEDLLSGMHPELFDCESLLYARESECVSVANVRDWLNSTKLSNEVGFTPAQLGARPANFVEVTDCFRDGLPSALTNDDIRGRYLGQYTWLGSQKFTAAQPRLTIKTLVHTSEVKPADLSDVSGDSIAQIESGTASCAVWPSEGKRYAFRHSRNGAVTLPFDLESRLASILRKRGLRGGVIEFSHNDAFEVTVLGSVQVTEAFLRDSARLISALEDSSPLIRFARQAALEKRVRAMAKLNRRVDMARTAPEVRFEGKFIGLAPRSESGAIAIFHKLEGMGALPFAYVSRAWAGAEGIDELADFQLSELQLQETDSPVEFEFEFENFFAHEHPMEQVKLIVCWSVRDQTLLDATKHPYLFKYKWDKGEIPVVLIQKLPGVTVLKEKT